MKIKFLLLTILFTGCQLSEKPDVDDIKENLVYFKDERTNLCFAAVNSRSSKSLSETSSIACVPCDSLKNVQVIGTPLKLLDK
jgi:hypothetical protein